MKVITGLSRRMYLRVFGNPMALNRYLRIMYIKPILMNVENKTILDIGCGDGSFTKYLAGRNNKIIAIDTENQDIEKILLGVKFKRADARKLPFKNSSFDFVFCSDVLEHVENYQLIVREAARVTKVGGLFLVSTVNGYWKSPIKVRLWLLNQPNIIRRTILGKFNQSDKKLHRYFLGHLNYSITPEVLEKLLRKNSVRMIELKKYCSFLGSLLMEIFFSFNMNLRYLIFPLLRITLPLDKIVSGRDYWQYFILGEKINDS